jgi:hypothetical protein
VQAAAPLEGRAVKRQWQDDPDRRHELPIMFGASCTAPTAGAAGSDNIRAPSSASPRCSADKPSDLRARCAIGSAVSQHHACPLGRQPSPGGPGSGAPSHVIKSTTGPQVTRNLCAYRPWRRLEVGLAESGRQAQLVPQSNDLATAPSPRAKACLVPELVTATDESGQRAIDRRRRLLRLAKERGIHRSTQVVSCSDWSANGRAR